MPKPGFKIAALAVTKVAILPEELCRLMPSVNKKSWCVLYRAGEAAAPFTRNPADEREESGRSGEVAQQAGNKHHVASTGDIPLGIKRGGQHLHQRMSSMILRRPSRKNQHAVRRFFGREQQETRQ